MAAILDLSGHFDFKKPASHDGIKYTRVSKKITDHCVITFSYNDVHLWNLANICSTHLCLIAFKNWHTAIFKLQLLSEKITSLNVVRSRWQRCEFYWCKFSRPWFQIAHKKVYLTFQLYQSEFWHNSTNE